MSRTLLPKHRSIALARTAALFTLPLLLAMLAAGQTPSAIVNMEPKTGRPLPRNFSGVNADLGLPVEYWDYRFNTLAGALGFGWVRFPGGTSSDIYNWQSGEDDYDWWQKFPAKSGVGGDLDTLYEVTGRGGARLIDAANRANMLGAPLIICVNGFTDTAESAGELAAFVKANNIQVAAWELSNEPYLYQVKPFWTSAKEYLKQMYPFYAAIHAVDPTALISIFITDQGHPGASASEWNLEVEKYPDKYWNAISYHSYPPVSGHNLDSWIEDERADLVNLTGPAFIGNLTPLGLSGVQFINSEFDPSLPQDSTPKLQTDGTLWGGVYAAEYTLRMSQTPGVAHVGPSEISHQAGIFLNNTFDDEILGLGKMDESMDTLSLDFGFYAGAQGLAASIANNVLKDAVESHPTTVVGGPTALATGIAGGIPAIYAMSYTNHAGRLSVVITNKGNVAAPVTLEVDGAAVPGPFPVEYVCASQPTPCANPPDAQNSPNTSANPTSESNVSVHSGVSQNPVTVEPYSVMRVDVETPSVLTFLNQASLRNPGSVYEWTQAAPEERVVAVLPTAQTVSALYVEDSTAKVVKVGATQLTATETVFTVPSGLAPGPITVSSGTVAASPLTGRLNLTGVVPGIYSANEDGAGVALAHWSWGSDVPPSHPAFACNVDVPMSCLPKPVPAGGVLQILSTGFRSAAHLKAFVAGQAAEVTSFGAYSGSGGYSASGTDQVTLTVPDALAGAGNSSVYIVADGKLSNMATIEIQ